jgi:hypothetical protein
VQRAEHPAAMSEKPGSMQLDQAAEGTLVTCASML